MAYPSDELLAKIKSWTPSKWDDIAPLVRMVADAWEYPDWAKETSPGLWVFATGGWSGNESLIEALGENPISYCCRRLSLEGGLHVFAITAMAKERMAACHERITAWAWAGGANL